MASTWDEELAPRMQQEHQAFLQLSQLLREHIAVMPAAPSAQWINGLRAGFQRLYTHIQRTIAIKEQDGYLQAILRERPTLTRQVEAIRNEHGQLLRMAAGSQAELAEIRPEDHVLVADACARLQRYMAVVGQHEQRESMIVLFAFNQDLGAQ